MIARLKRTPETVALALGNNVDFHESCLRVTHVRGKKKWSRSETNRKTITRVLSAFRRLLIAQGERVPKRTRLQFSP